MPATGSLQLVEAVVERFEGAPVGERRRWSDDFKEQAVRAALEPGGNGSALARRLGISPAQLFGWRRAFLNKGIEAGAAHAPEPMVEIVIGDVTIRVSPAFSETAPRWPQSSVWPGLWPWGGLPGRPCSRQPLDLFAHDQLTGSVKPDQMERLLADVDPDHGEFFYASFLLRSIAGSPADEGASCFRITQRWGSSRHIPLADDRAEHAAKNVPLERALTAS